MEKVTDGVAKVTIARNSENDKAINLLMKLDCVTFDSQGQEIIWLDLLFATMHENTQAICITDKIAEEVSQTRGADYYNIMKETREKRQQTA